MKEQHVPVLQRVGRFLGNTWSGVRDGYDWGALPAFTIFLAVVTLGMFLNYLAMHPVIGKIPALLVSGLFEFGILGWELTYNRKRNNEDQTETVVIATWASVSLAVIMLVINLFRTTIEQSIKAEIVSGVTVNGWQIAAYVVIGLAALVHIIGYLRFDHLDTDKKNARANRRAVGDIEQRAIVAENLVRNADSDLQIIENIEINLNGLREKYMGLPHDKLEIVLENARQALLVQYEASDLVKAATSKLADLDGSGAIGDVPEQAPFRLQVGSEEEDVPGDGSRGEYLAKAAPDKKGFVPAFPKAKKVAPAPVLPNAYYIFVTEVELRGQSVDGERVTPFYKVPAEQRETARYLLGLEYPDTPDFRYAVGFHVAEFLENLYHERGEVLPTEPLPFSLEGLRDRNGMADPRARVIQVEPELIDRSNTNGKKPPFK